VARLQQKYMAAGTTGPEGHAYSRPPEVKGEATNRCDREDRCLLQELFPES
jgi:hypothetical protein